MGESLHTQRKPTREVSLRSAWFGSLIGQSHVSWAFGENIILGAEQSTDLKLF